VQHEGTISRDGPQRTMIMRRRMRRVRWLTRRCGRCWHVLTAGRGAAQVGGGAGEPEAARGGGGRCRACGAAAQGAAKGSHVPVHRAIGAAGRVQAQAPGAEGAGQGAQAGAHTAPPLASTHHQGSSAAAHGGAAQLVHTPAHTFVAGAGGDPATPRGLLWCSHVCAASRHLVCSAV
jgi:hypothetical protein